MKTNALCSLPSWDWDSLLAYRSICPDFSLTKPGDQLMPTWPEWLDYFFLLSIVNGKLPFSYYNYSFFSQGKFFLIFANIFQLPFGHSRKNWCTCCILFIFQQNERWQFLFIAMLDRAIEPGFSSKCEK